ncbi:MAG: radical SAM protein [Nannocystaceae bacterium]|nr:radical SAM protein [Nannocystaceae bacterium]
MCARGHEVELIDAFTLPDAGLERRDDGRLYLGAPVDSTLAAAQGEVHATVIAYTPFHRPPHRDDVLAAVLEGLRGPLILADLYQSGQHYVQVPGDSVLAAYPELDAYVQYEGERSVPEILEAGTATGVIRGEQPDLAELPTPDWSLIDVQAYWRFHERVVAKLGRAAWAFPITKRTLPIVTSRGCPFTCIHCSSNPDRLPGEPKTQRRRPAASLRDAFAAMTTLGAGRVAVLDEMVNVHRSHFDALLDAVEHTELLIEVPNGMRADYLRAEDFPRLRERITTISVSAESGSPEVVREVVRKKLELTHIQDAARHAHEAGVSLLVHYMIGLPGERAEQINETLAFALRLWDEFGAYPAVQYATPLPGTELAAHTKLPIVEDWGPRFQKAASITGCDVPPETLTAFMDTFQTRLDASSGPKKLIMNVTYACNNHCTFCAVGTRTQIDGHPPRQREQLDRYRAQGVEMVDFDGGEPTLNPELVGLIRYSRSIGYRMVNVTTNGRMCAYESYASKLVQSGLTTLLFSVHGHDARTHAQQVGVAEAFEQTTQGIRNCVRLRPAGVELGMNVTITKGNHDKQHELTELAWSLGLKWLNIQFLTPFGRATHHVAPDTQAAADQTRSVIDTFGDRMKIQVINLPYCFMPGYERYLQGDLLKLERHMVFVNNETVNLAGYLAERRTRKPQCATCPHACFCGGFYELDDVPEPPWLIEASDLVRPLDDPRRHESVPTGFQGRVAQRLGEDSETS